MTRPVLRFLLDENVPESVRHALTAASHRVDVVRDIAPRGSPDSLVCTIAEDNDLILVSHDRDMKRLARRFGAGRNRFKRLSLVKLSCRETRSAARIAAALSLIEHEWLIGDPSLRRLHIEIGDSVIRTNR